MPTVYSLPWFFQQFCDSNGDPLSGGKVQCKNAGTSDDKDTYSDTDGTTPNANPVILDSSGMAVIFLESGTYDFYVYDSSDNLIKTIEGINSQTTTTQVDTMADLKALPAGSSPVVRTLGYSTINDGGGWWYYWASASTATNDDGMVIQPDSLPATGRWLGFFPSTGELDLKTYGATCDGTTDDVSELQACDTYCAANGLNILISDHTYVATDPSLSSKVHLLQNCQLRWAEFTPRITLDVIIDGNDKTQHFNCTASYVPTLNVSELYPQWFGENWASHPITTAALTALTGQLTKILTSINIAFGVQGAAIFDSTLQAAGITSTSTLTVGTYLYIASHTPSSASDTGTVGTICWDADYIYICTATDTWKRVAIATW